MEDVDVVGPALPVRPGLGGGSIRCLLLGTYGFLIGAAAVVVDVVELVMIDLLKVSFNRLLSIVERTEANDSVDE